MPGIRGHVTNWWVSSVLCALPLMRYPGYTVLWGLLTRYGLAQAYSLSTLPTSFLLALYGLIFIDLLPSCLSCCERNNVCCSTKSHGLETQRPFPRYNGLVIPCFSSQSLYPPFTISAILPSPFGIGVHRVLYDHHSFHACPSGFIPRSPRVFLSFGPPLHPPPISPS